jgi:hypothetical protein
MGLEHFIFDISATELKTPGSDFDRESHASFKHVITPPNCYYLCFSHKGRGSLPGRLLGGGRASGG